MKFIPYLLIFPAIIVALVVGVVVCAKYLPPPKPTFVNQTLSFENKLIIPPLLEPNTEGDEKVFTLQLQKGEMEFIKGKKTSTLGVNGNYLGPTLHFHTGDNVRLHVTNAIGEETTIHWHGMSLPASMDGGPHQAISSGETWKPHWLVTNEASTLWYHPHFMEKTGEQVHRGLAGLIIVDDKNSESLALPKEYGVDDIPLVIQDREFAPNGQFIYRHDQKDFLGETGMLGDTILVNGTYAPYLSVPAKQIRLRLLNGSNTRRYTFRFDDNRRFYQLATDGGFLEKPVERSKIVLSPGERVEILVNLSKQTAPLMLMSDPVVEESVVFRFVKHLLLMERDENQSFAIIQLRPEQSDSETYSLPDTLSAIERLDASQAKKTRTFVLDPGSRTINKKQMNPDRIDEVVHAGDIEIWTVKNHSGTYHPFHIHGVQFQIVDVDGKPPQDFERGWKDTILVPNGKDMSLIMKFPMYADAHVPYMYHCHILEHEDMGMMGQFVVLPIVPEENLFK